MPRRAQIPKRPILPDPVFQSPLVTRFINNLMLSGKKSIAESTFYGAMDTIKERTSDDPLRVFRKAVDNVKPALEVKSRRVGGSNYQVPIEVRPQRRTASRKKREPAFSPRGGERKSRRLAMAAANQQVTAQPGAAVDGEASDNGDDEEWSPEGKEEQNRAPDEEQRSTAGPTQIAKVTVGAPSAAGRTTCLSVERAKTGRSKCRACREAIPQGMPRVGQHAWIMGRNSIVWSHPKCCLERLVVAVESSGRSKCKASGRALVKGEPKIGLRAHTATAWVSLQQIASVLAPVMAVLPSQHVAAAASIFGQGEPTQLPLVEGFAKLSAEHQAAVKTALSPLFGAKQKVRTPTSPGPAGLVGGTPPKTVAADGRKNAGKVAWKFAGKTCFGELMPGRETSTHCYARTHKGNVKTLTKGKKYWWLVQ